MHSVDAAFRSAIGAASAGGPHSHREYRQWRRAPFAVATWERIAASLSDLRAAKYEIAIDLQGAVRSSLLARWSGAPVIYGSAQPRENLATMFYTRQIITNSQHVVEQNLSLAEAVAHRRMRLPSAELPRDAAAEQECDLRFKAYGTRGVALLNPGAGWGAKQWPPERYGQVAQQLSEDGLKVLINFGPGEEDLASAVENASNGAAEKFTRHTDSTHRANSSRKFVHRRRYRPYASGGGAGHPGGRNFRSDRSRAQRAIWHAQCCVTQFVQ